MPHYRNGEKAKIGDIAKASPTTGQTVIGPLTSITESDTCNALLANQTVVYEGTDGTRVVTPGVGQSYVTLKDCDKVA